MLLSVRGVTNFIFFDILTAIMATSPKPLLESQIIRVTECGYALLLERREVLAKELQDIKDQKQYAFDHGGDGWHDNFSFEQLSQQEMMTAKQIGDLEEKLSRTMTVGAPDDDTKLSIGHYATLRFPDATERVISVAGFGESDSNAVPPRLDYTASLLRPFIGHPEGTAAEVVVGQRKLSVTLVRISRTP